MLEIRLLPQTEKENLLVPEVPKGKSKEKFEKFLKKVHKVQKVFKKVIKKFEQN
jgi:hypothetical protein